MVDSFEASAVHPDFHPSMKSIIDLREFEGMSGDDIRRLSQYLRENRDRVGAAQAALVVSKPSVYGLMRMIQVHTETARHLLEVFYDLDDAQEWLGIA